MTRRYDLSFQVELFTWDGQCIGMRPIADIRQQLQQLQDAGLSWAMVGGVQFSEPADFDFFEAARTIHDLIAEYGLRLSSHHCVLRSFAPLEGSQTAARDVMLKTVEACALLAPRVLVIHPGDIAIRYQTAAEYNQAFVEQEQKHGLDAIIDVVAENLAVMADAAAEHDMRLALENLGRFTPLADEDTLPRLVSTVDRPNVGYCIDSGHAHVFGQSVTKWLEVAGDKLFETHFHDNRGRGGEGYPKEGFVVSSREYDEHLPVGFGTISWLDVIQTLITIDYRGPICCETTGWPDDDVASGLRQAVAWWRACEALAQRD